MKLTNLTIDDYGVCQRIHLDDFSNGINIIHGPNGSGKTTIRDFFTKVLFGYSDATEGQMRGVHSDQYSPLRGSLEAIIGEQRVRVTRDNYSSRDARYELLKGVGKADAIKSSGLNESAFRTVYNVGFRETRIVVPSIVALLRSQFGDKENARWRTDSEFDRWKKEADDRSTRLDTLQRRIEELRKSRSPIQRRIEDDHRHHQMRLDEIDRHLNEIAVSSESMSQRLRDITFERENVEREIAELEQRIEENRNKVRYVPDRKPIPDRLATLYEMLDEIDEQIGRWREVQNDIQMHRVQIRDDLTQWKALSVDSTDHPYHRSQKLLHRLENRVIDAEKEARKPVPQNEDSGESLRRNELVSICNKMRDEIFELCQEIGRQYRNVRHRSAAGELKQLRRCYHELDDSVSRLAARRNTVIDDLRELDPQGADAIVRADLQFCRCAKHEGFLAARQHYIGPIPNVSQHDYGIVQTDTAAELQLAELTLHRDEFVEQFNDAESHLHGLLSRRKLLLDERGRIDAKFEFAALQNRLEKIDTELQHSVRESEGLRRQVEEDRPWYQWAPNPVFSNVSEYVRRVTCGDLIEVRFSDDDSTPVVTDSSGKALSFDSLSRGNQDQVCLSLCLAAVDAFADRGIRMPVLFDDVFINIDQHRATATMGVLRDFCLQGHQVILFTCHQHIANQFESFGTTTFELPMTTTTTPVSVPGRIEPVVPRSEFIHSDMLPKCFSRPDSATIRPDRVRSNNEPVQEIYRYSSERRRPPTASRTTRVEAAADTIISDRTSLRLVQLFEPDELANLKRCGISTVGDLLSVAPTDSCFELSRDRITENDLFRWQACCWLMVCVPGLQACDATVLHDCGICEPEQLSNMTSDQIEIRISRHLESGNGRNSRIGHGRYDSLRINNWLRNLEDTRSNWNSPDGQSQYSRRLERVARAEWRPRNERDLKPAAQPVGRSSAETSSNLDSNDLFKFNLDRADEIEAAPSIGAKTAERFQAIGVTTVADFLSREPEEMAKELDYRRLNVKTLKTWQKQAKLVCQVPNLRGHDAQILVACSINTPEEINAMDPPGLMKIIGPFSKTKEGEKIIRNGKKPDLDEITNWIYWASKTRAIQAA
ncbi:DUF4332 domain-containing protein [Vicingaceae bacterium]|nr:DUF4332 domain-containing protein [Vicingaceae bacterium]